MVYCDEALRKTPRGKGEHMGVYPVLTLLPCASLHPYEASNSENSVCDSLF